MPEHMYDDASLDSGCAQNDESIWSNLYNLLLPKAKGWAYNSGVMIWRGQEYDVAWDIVLTAIERTFAYMKRATEDGILVHSPEHLSVVIAKNYYRDLRRHEQRLQRFTQDDETALGEHRLLDNLTDPSEEASEKVYEEWLLAHSARNIATFSKKLRAAILIDLAKRMHFGAEPTPLQQAFLNLGIYLQDYREQEPLDPHARSSQTALRSLAYKRTALLMRDLDISLTWNMQKR
jgi:hypothetical protein